MLMLFLSHNLRGRSDRSCLALDCERSPLPQCETNSSCAETIALRPDKREALENAEYAIAPTSIRSAFYKIRLLNATVFHSSVMPPKLWEKSPSTLKNVPPALQAISIFPSPIFLIVQLLPEYALNLPSPLVLPAHQV